MRGSQVFMDSLVAHEVDCIFGNPGTTESPLLDGLVDYPQIEYYVALHEAVANLHVAPGLGNAIGMMYGALKANSPLIVTAGQQDTRMRLRDPLLSHDLVAMAAPVTKWSAEPQNADDGLSAQHLYADCLVAVAGQAARLATDLDGAGVLDEFGSFIEIVRPGP